MIPPSFVQELLGRIDIVDIVGRHVALKKSGINHSGLCPFHGEKSPSFFVSPSRQTYHCFGCGVHGNAVGFLMEHLGLGFVETIQDLAQQAGLKVPEDERSPAEREKASAKKQLQATLSETLARCAEHYRKQLKASPRAISYLQRRGLSGEVARRFGLGYAPEGWRSLASAIAHYDDPMLEASGMVIIKEGEEDQEAERRRYDRFRDRIMFPIRSATGEVIAFGGRVLDQGEPKYLNSPETPVFSKGKELYGLFEARQGMRQRGYALVVEGYMDVVALAQAGFENAVATLGTACTAEHVQKLFRFTDSVVFSFDGDAAGRKAAARALEASLAFATDVRTVRFLFLPPEHDPDSYVREHGAPDFEACVAAALPLSRQLLDVAAQGCDLQHAEGRARMLAQARPLWTALPAGAVKHQLLDEIATQARMTRTDVQGLWGAMGGDSSGARGASGRRDAPSGARQWARRPSQGAASLLDRALWLLVNRSSMWDEIGPDAKTFLCEQPPPHGPAAARIERQVHDDGPLDRQSMLELLRDPELGPQAQAFADRLDRLLAPEPDTNFAQEFALLLNRLRLAAVEEELKSLFESGKPSPDALQRSQQLRQIQIQLKSTAVATRF